MTVVYTTVFGNTDPLHELKHKGKARYICFTDQEIKSETWEVIKVLPTKAPATKSRRYKCQPHLIFGDTPTIWVDACLDCFFDPEDLLKKYKGVITNFEHPDRCRIKNEAKAIIKAQKAPEKEITNQLSAYQKEGFDLDSRPMQSLSNNGFILRRNCQKLNELWWHEVKTKSRRDQMSLDYCAWKLGITINKFQGNIRKNPYVKYNHYNRPVND